jgi:outer membrane protein assembly factor BamB
MGSSWNASKGSFTTDGNFAVSGAPPVSGNWAAVVPSLGTSDYSVVARLSVPAGSLYSGIVARSSVPGAFDSDLYAAQISTQGQVNLYRRNSWSWTLLASAPASISAGTEYSLELDVSGSSPVQLAVSLNGAQAISVADSSASRITSGVPGIENYDANVKYDSFVVTGAGTTASPDFAISASPSSLTGAGTSSITVSPVNGFAGTVNLAVSGMPSGSSATFSPTSISGGGSSTLTLSPGTAAAGTYSLTVTGTSGSLSQHSTSISWTIAGSADFSISSSPSSVSGSATAAIAVTAQNGFSGTVSLAVGGVPSGASATLSPTGVPGSGSSTLTLSIGTAAAGTYPLTVTGTSGSLSHSTSISWTIAGSADFAISSSPSSVSGSATAAITVTAQNGFSGTVSLAVGGVPSGASATLSPTSVSGSGSSTLTLSIGTAAAGTYSLTVTGTSGSLSHSTSISWTISGTTSSVLFSDDFSRTSGMGGSWDVNHGSFTTDGNFAVSGAPPVSGNWAAVVPSLGTSDYSVVARLSVPAGSLFSGVVARSSIAGAFDSDLYAAQISTQGQVNLYRRNSWAWTQLGTASAAIAAGTEYTLELDVSGSSPVQLTVSLNGARAISVADSSASRITSGVPGIENYDANVKYDSFVVSGAGSPPPPPPPPPPTGGDWPFYRHDVAGTSNAGGSITSAQAANLRLLFQVSIPVSVANPVVANGTLYIASAGRLLALDAQTGATRWSRGTGVSTAGACTFSQGAVGAAAVVGNTVYAPGGDGNLYAFDTNGNQLWATPVANTANDEFLWSSAIPIGGSIYVGIATLEESTCSRVVPGRLVGVDQVTGAITGTWWADANHGDGGGIWTSAAFDPALGRIFVTTGNVDFGVSASNEPWQQAFVAINQSTLQTADSLQPVGTDFTTDFDFGASPTLYETSAGRHMVVATNKNGLVYALDRTHLAGGVLWTSTISVASDSVDLGSGSIVSPTFANGHVFVGGGTTPDGFVGAIAALDPATGATMWKMHPDGFVLPAMAASGSVLAAGVSHSSDGTGRIYVLDQSSGAVLFTLATAGKIFAEPTWANGVLYVVDLAGNLYALSP